MSSDFNRVPTRTGKPGKMGRHFPVRERPGILNRLEKSGKITQNTGKIRVFEIILFDIFNDIKMNCVLFGKMDQVFSLRK